jgi:hydroxyacylglutathione hydrolase
MASQERQDGINSEGYMTVQIHTIPLGMVNCYLLKGEKYVLIDAGIPGLKKPFFQGLKDTGVQLEQIELVVITHGHMDHIGLAKVVKELTGAKLAIHEREVDWLENGKSPLPPGATPFGKILMSLGGFMPPITVEPTVADIVITDDGLSLETYGLPGKVVYTPGHTMGSVTVLLASGEAFVGDLAMSARFMRATPGLPIFAEDLDLVVHSWEELLDLGAKTIYPAHGKPFPADVFRKKLL